MNQQLLVREVKRRNRLSNIMITFGILMDLMPQAAVVHMIGNALSGTLSHGLSSTKPLTPNLGIRFSSIFHYC